MYNSRSDLVSKGENCFISFIFRMPYLHQIKCIQHKLDIGNLKRMLCRVFWSQVEYKFVCFIYCICRNTGMCHYFGYIFWGCSQIFGYLVGYSRIFGYPILVKFDFFQNNPDFGLLILIFPSMTLWNVACRALVSMILQFSLLFYYVCAKSSMLSITAISLSSYTCSGF